MVSMPPCTVLPVLLAATCLSCTAIVKSRAGDPPDASSDSPADAEPDFDPDSCGLWGRVFVQEPENINIDTADPTLDCDGRMSLAVMSKDADGNPLSAGHVFEDVNALEGDYYCLPPDVLSSIDEGFIDVLFIDTMSHWEDEQYVQFKSMQTDPLAYTLYLLSLWYPGTDYTVYTDLYWDGESGNRFDIPLSVRASRVPLEVRFSGFSYGSGRRARLCVYAVGVREDPTFNFVAIGATYLDLADDQVSNTSVVPMQINLSAEVGQQYKVLVYYVESRELFDDTSSFLKCGDLRTPRSCALDCAILTDPEGTHVSDTLVFDLSPITGECPYDELSVCPD